MNGWLKIVSWHIVSGVVSRGGMLRTLCGRWVDVGTTVLPEPEPNERTCERCFQLREQAK